MIYGIPYKGSKNAIADKLVDVLPSCDRFLDACCGGGAITVAACLSGKFEAVVANDLNPAVVKLLDAVLIHKGQIEYNHPSVCSRQDFVESLERISSGNFSIQDCVNKFCASFGNDGKTYLYGKHVEDYKLTAERMLTAPTLEERRKAYRKFYANVMKGSRLNELQYLQRVQSLERLERLERLDIFNIDYSQYDCVYFDIPYKGTNKYDFDFDHERFYELFKSIKIPAFMSEYDAPFTCVASFDHVSRMAAKVGSKGKIQGLEKLFFNRSFEEYNKLMEKTRYGS